MGIKAIENRIEEQKNLIREKLNSEFFKWQESFLKKKYKKDFKQKRIELELESLNQKYKNEIKWLELNKNKNIYIHKIVILSNEELLKEYSKHSAELIFDFSDYERFVCLVVEAELKSRLKEVGFLK